MSALYLFPPEQEPSEDVDLLAAEHALGVLDPGDAAATRLRADGDPVLAAAIARWQQRLALLTEALPLAEPPPMLWRRLAADAGLPETPAPPRPTTASAPATAAPEPEPYEEFAEPEAEPAREPVASEPPAAAPPPLAEAQPPQVQEWEPAEWVTPADPPAPEMGPSPAPYPPPREPGGLFVPLAVWPESDSAPEFAPQYDDLPRIPPRPSPSRPPQTRAAPPWFENLLVWRVACGVLLVLVIGLALLAVPRAIQSRAVAAIGPVSAPAPLFLAEVDLSGHLVLTPLATIAVPNGRDLELWMLPPNSTDRPTSLGVLPAGGRIINLSATPAEGTQLLVSMEPRGGAPGGTLTGPVLYGGTLANH